MFSTVIGFVLANMLFLALHLESRVLPEPLTPRQEKEEFEKYFNGDMTARDKLIKHNLRLVAHVVKKYYQGPVENDYLMSIGTIGLIKAVQSFSSEKQVKFSTYASKCIDNEVLMYMRSSRKNSQDISMSEPIDTDSEGNPLTFSDVIYEDDTIADDIDLNEKTRQLYGFVEELESETEKTIIILRYGLYNKKPLTQREVAQRLGISRSYVSRIEKRVLEHLRERFEG